MGALVSQVGSEIASGSLTLDDLFELETALGVSGRTKFRALRALLLPPNKQIATYATYASVTTAIPIDDTIPQVGEGTQILSATITARASTSLFRYFFHTEATASGTMGVVAALFKDGAADAIDVNGATVGAIGYWVPLTMVGEVAAGDTSAHTVTVRVGPQSGTMYLNGGSAQRYFGGKLKSTLIVEEIMQ